ncbi:hypothetical protein GCM10023075_51280 [Streptosporangium album]
MDAAKERLVGIVKELDTTTDTLMTQITNDFAGAWEGDAVEFFAEHKKRWDNIEATMVVQLQQAAVAIGIAKENYELAEAKNKNLWIVN